MILAIKDAITSKLGIDACTTFTVDKSGWTFWNCWKESIGCKLHTGKIQSLMDYLL
jgi:hypothetical protein